VDDSALRVGFFGLGDSFFNADVVTAFTAGNKTTIVDALYDRIVGIQPVGGGADLLTAPSRAAVRAELIGPNPDPEILDPDNMFDRLAGSCPVGACSATRTQTVVKSMCAATLGSAAMLVQ
jgi:hypothetical protein